MFKHILYGSGAVGALAAAYLVGSLTLGGAFAQASPTAPAQSQAQPPATNLSTSDHERGGASEQSETASLASQAKITFDQASAAALAKFPGATIGKVALENENGAAVYSVQLTDSAGKAQDVKVDAVTGQVSNVQADGPEGPDTGTTQDGAETED